MKYTVKLEGAIIVTGYVDVEAASPEQAIADVKAQVEVDVDALGDPSWEFVDLKTVTDIAAVEVFDDLVDGAGDA